MRNPKLIISICLNLLLGIAYYHCLKRPWFEQPLSTVLLDREGHLLSARIADDGQWRFPERDTLPPRFEQCLLQFEDRHFYSHPGVHLPSVARAIWQNMGSEKRVSGGSTITMQVIRMMRGNPPRTYTEKVIEMVLATRLELSASKEEIIGLWASHAPFGGNVVGLDAAAWRYFGRSAEELSWAESATLAVLPNAPSLIFPGKNQEALITKRNRLLHKMMEAGVIDRETCELAKMEPVPGQPHPLPQQAFHLMQHLEKQAGRGHQFRSTIDPGLQTRTESILEEHASRLANNKIYNLCAIIIRVEDGQVLAYAGNVKGDPNNPAPHVDIIHSQRSTGSILKPLLYASMLDDGELLPHMLVPDIPMRMGEFAPENYSQSYDGAVPASRALARSLNIPSVHLLQQHGIEKFHKTLRELGFSHIDRPASHYGLSLILGGAEASLWEITRAYASMARTVRNFGSTNGKYDRLAWLRQDVLLENTSREPELSEHNLISAGSSYLTFKALLEVNRPETETGWQWFSSTSPMAWKTGTSYGFRDAWSVGCTSEYVIGVWVGNATGEGRPGLTGVNAAAPVLFQLADLLPAAKWFDPPYDALTKVITCTASGYRAGSHCPEIDTIYAPVRGREAEICPHHRLIHLSPDKQFRASSDCFPSLSLADSAWFVLPPVQAWYYRRKHPEYRSLPPIHPECAQGRNDAVMQLIYPSPGQTVFIPVDIDGSLSELVMEAAHAYPGRTIFWHMDDEYLGQTTELHTLNCRPSPGRHKLTLVDEEGNSIELELNVTGKSNPD